MRTLVSIAVIKRESPAPEDPEDRRGGTVVPNARRNTQSTPRRLRDAANTKDAKPRRYHDAMTPNRVATSTRAPKNNLPAAARETSADIYVRRRTSADIVPAIP